MVNSFMQEFMGMMGDHMHKLGEKQAHNAKINEAAAKEEAMKQIINKPEYRVILPGVEPAGLSSCCPIASPISW